MTLHSYDTVIRNIPGQVVEHLTELLQSCNIKINRSNITRAAQTWLTKRGLFDRIITQGNFKRITTFSAQTPSPCIALTLSGSIIVIGPLKNSVRQTIYTSITIRNDVPKSHEEPHSVLNGDIFVGRPILFETGHIKQTSPIIDMALIPEGEHDLQKQFARILAANRILQNKFIEINRDFILSKDLDDDLNNRNDLFDRWIILSWFRTGGIEEAVFYGRSKILWLELFTDLYDLLTTTIENKTDRDRAFLDLTNNRFSGFLDVYKWIESEKKDFDIGLMKAMEELPLSGVYKNFCDEYRAGIQ